MKNHKHLLVLFSIAIALAATILLIPKKGSYADFGDFSGDSDYGGYDGSGYSGGSSSSWSSRDSSSYSRKSTGSRKSSIGTIVISLIIMAIIAYKKDKPQKRTPVSPEASSPSLNLSELKKNDPNFDEKELKSKISNLYIQFQQAWEKKDISTLRPYLTDTAYAQYDRQLDRYRQANETNKIEHPAVLSVVLTGWKEENGKDIIFARLNTRITDYVISDKTGEIVKGNKREKFMEYEWILERSSDMKTSDQEGATVQKCPNCSGSININQTAKCPYCRFLVTTDKFNWQVREIKGISQRTS